MMTNGVLIKNKLTLQTFCCKKKQDTQKCVTFLFLLISDPVYLPSLNYVSEITPEPLEDDTKESLPF